MMIPPDQEARYDEENVDPDISSRDCRHTQVKEDDRDDGDCAQAVNVSAVSDGLRHDSIPLRPATAILAQTLPRAAIG